jgi:ABC-type phosphate transport system substrate-binding protein
MKQFIKPLLGLTFFALVQFAQAEHVVVVSSKSTVGNLSKEQIADIYLGSSKEFPNGGQALPLLQSGGSLRAEFFDKILGKSEAQAKSIWSRIVFSGKGNAPREVGDSAEVLKLIAANPNYIGIVEKSAVNSSVKVVYTSP